MIFSLAMGANYSFELISIESYAPQFIGHNKLFLGSVTAVMYYKVSLEMDLLLQSQTQMDKKKRITALS